MKFERLHIVLVPFSIFLITVSIYFLLSPGRIDMTDSLVRLEGTKGVLQTGFPIVDSKLGATTGVGKTKLGENIYASMYGVSPHLLYAPFVKMIQVANGGFDAEMFWFSHINHLFAGLSIAVLFLFYSGMGLRLKDAVLWSLICAFFTQFFVTATSSFYQILQGCLLLLAVFFAYQAGRRQSFTYVLLASIFFVVFVNIKMSYVILAPFIGLLFLYIENNKIKITRKTIYFEVIFIFFCILAMWFWQSYRSVYMGGKENIEPLVDVAKSVGQASAGNGNILMGLFILLFSPGKGALFYSPIFFVALFGIKSLLLHHKLLAVSASCIIGIWVLGIAQTPFPGGDWCWGPRYLVPIAPLIFLFVPYGYRYLFANKLHLGRMLLAYCLLVQILGLSLDFHQFFYRNGLPAFFWKDQSFYSTHSQLAERPIDIIASIHQYKSLNLSGSFRPGPYPESLTFPIFGVYHPDREVMVYWMKQYPIFWLPRPWPVWMQLLDTGRLPIHLHATIFFGFSLFLSGCVLLGWRLAKHRSEKFEYLV